MIGCHEESASHTGETSRCIAKTDARATPQVGEYPPEAESNEGPQAARVRPASVLNARSRSPKIVA